MNTPTLELKAKAIESKVGGSIPWQNILQALLAAFQSFSSMCPQPTPPPIPKAGEPMYGWYLWHIRRGVRESLNDPRMLRQHGGTLVREIAAAGEASAPEEIKAMHLEAESE